MQSDRSARGQEKPYRQKWQVTQVVHAMPRLVCRSWQRSFSMPGKGARASYARSRS